MGVRRSFVRVRGVVRMGFRDRVRFLFGWRPKFLAVVWLANTHPKVEGGMVVIGYKTLDVASDRVLLNGWRIEGKKDDEIDWSLYGLDSD